MRWPWQRPKDKPRTAKCLHPKVFDEAGGMMADAYCCVICGRDKYPEVFGITAETIIERRPVDPVTKVYVEATEANWDAAP